MARPGTVLSWSTSGPITTPSGGKIASGFAPSERGAAQYFNYLFNLAGLWIAWLAAGILDGNWEFTGNVQVDGTTTLQNDATVASNKNIILQGTGKVKRGSRVRHLSAMAGLQVSGTAMTIDASHDMWLTSNANNVFRQPIPLEENEQLTLVTCRIADSGSDVLTMKIYKDDFTGTNPVRTQLGTTANSTGSTGALETLSSGALTEAVGATAIRYFAEFTCTFSAGCQIGGLDITTTVP